MRITDGRMVVHLDDDDPRAVRVRAILFAQSSATAPIAALWAACTGKQRELLVAVAERGEVEQAELERVLRAEDVALRGLLGGLSKHAKRVGVPYPIRSVGARRAVRRFSVDGATVRDLLKLAKATPGQKGSR